MGRKHCIVTETQNPYIKSCKLEGDSNPHSVFLAYGKRFYPSCATQDGRIPLLEFSDRWHSLGLAKIIEINFAIKRNPDIAQQYQDYLSAHHRPSPDEYPTGSKIALYKKLIKQKVWECGFAFFHTDDDRNLTIFQLLENADLLNSDKGVAFLMGYLEGASLNLPANASTIAAAANRNHVGDLTRITLDLSNLSEEHSEEAKRLSRNTIFTATPAQLVSHEHIEEKEQPASAKIPQFSTPTPSQDHEKQTNESFSRFMEALGCGIILGGIGSAAISPILLNCSVAPDILTAFGGHSFNVYAAVFGAIFTTYAVFGLIRLASDCNKAPLSAR